jgi:hypothetical protein
MSTCPRLAAPINGVPQVAASLMFAPCSISRLAISAWP